MTISAIGVVHLIRACNGIEPLERFLASYQRHPAGVDHDLVLVLKGFDRGVIPDEMAHILSEFCSQNIFAPDRGLDIGPYLKVAAHLRQPWLCFLNSFSEILADGWLDMLFRQASQPGVGMAGATGTFESHLTAFEKECRHNRSKLPYKLIMRKVNLLQMRRLFPPFPNPHLRTNAILIQKDRFLESWRKPVRNKLDAHCFESGKASLSAGLLNKGLQLLVVGKDGIGYLPETWQESKTFRSGNQENLLVGDNQTRHYEKASPTEKAKLALLSWSNRITRG